VTDKAVGLRMNMQRARSIHSHVQVFGVIANSIKSLIEGKEFRLKALPSALGELQKLLKP
jgi:hypothetical protein